MTSSEPNFPEKSDALEASKQTPEISEKKSPETSATTPDIPAFGWSNYAERINGRFAMIGFTAILLIEAFSHRTFLEWAGILS